MKKEIVPTALLVALCLLGCKNTPPDNPVYPPGFQNKIATEKLTLVKTGSIEIPLDTATLNFSHYPVYYANDTSEFYVYGNEIINSIDFYDLDKKKLVRRNMYPKDGPGGILFTLKLFVKSLDSIYVYSEDTKKILLTNFEGKPLAQYTTPEFWMSNLLQPLTVIGDRAFFGRQLFGDNRAQIGYRTMIQYDLKTGAYREFGPPFPTVFKDSVYRSFIPFFTFAPNNVVVQFGSLPVIYNYAISTDSTTAIPMRSIRQEKEILPVEIDEETGRPSWPIERVVDVYSGVHYDPYNHVYYSIFKKGIPATDAEGNETAWEDKPQSIIIFNENFEYAGEVFLPEKIYYDNYICSKKGLLIPTSNPKNPENNENILHFDVFTLQKQ